MRTSSIGMILIAIGMIMMIYTGFNYVTAENVVDVGSLQINREVDHPVYWSPIVGAFLLVAGIAAMIGGKKAIVK